MWLSYLQTVWYFSALPLTFVRQGQSSIWCQLFPSAKVRLFSLPSNFWIVKFSSLAIGSKHYFQPCVMLDMFLLILLSGSFPSLGYIHHTHVLLSVLLNAQGSPFADLWNSQFSSALHFMVPILWVLTKWASPDLHLCLLSLRRWPWSAWHLSSLPQLWNSLKTVNWGNHKIHRVCFLSLRHYYLSVWHPVSWKPLFCLDFLVVLDKRANLHFVTVTVFWLKTEVLVYLLSSITCNNVSI